jgi:hypothetical protein
MDKSASQRSVMRGISCICLLQIVFIVMTASLSYSQYTLLSKKDQAVVSAIDAIVSAEQLYFIDYGRYTSNYNELASLSLVKDINVNYGLIQLNTKRRSFFNAKTHGISFNISHKEPGSTLFIYDSSSKGTKVSSVPGKGLTSSVW